MRTGRRTGWLDGCGCGVFAEESLGPGELARMAAALARVCSAEAPVSLDSSDSVWLAGESSWSLDRELLLSLLSSNSSGESSVGGMSMSLSFAGENVGKFGVSGLESGLVSETE